MVLELNHRMKYEGLATGAYISLTEDERTERLETIRKEAFELVKARLLVRRIIEAEKLDVSAKNWRKRRKHCLFVSKCRSRW